METEHRGVLTGAPITDIRITLVSGKGTFKAYRGRRFQTGGVPRRPSGLKAGRQCFVRTLL